MRTRIIVLSCLVVCTDGGALAASRADDPPRLVEALRAVEAQASRIDRPKYDGPPLTLADALDEALRKNPDLMAFRQQVDVVRQRPARERWLAPPTFETQIWQWPINSVNPANTNMYMFMVNQDLPGFGKRALRRAAAEKKEALATADVAVRAQQIADGVKQAYVDLFLARTATDIGLEAIDLVRQLADASEAKYAAGRISQQDVLKAVVEISRLHADLIRFDEQAGRATARLNSLLDRPPDATIGPLVEPREGALLPSEEELQRLALAHQPELQRARAEIERAGAARDVARRDYKPDFSVLGGYMLMPGQTDAVMAKVGVTWPGAPWARGRIEARVAEATAAVGVAKAQQHAMENALRLAVRDAYVRVKAAEQRASLLRATVLPQSRQTFEVSRVGYQSDRVEFLALLDNERVLLDTRLDYVRALGDFEQAMADLDRAVGIDVARVPQSGPTPGAVK